MSRVTEALGAAPSGWDALTVDPPGGHLLQGSAWAEHRRSQGWQPTFIRFDDGRAALILTHARRPLPGVVAYAPRGPIAGGDRPAAVAARAAALGDWLRGHGASILAVDPELDADPDYDAALSSAGFRPTEEIQPSRHRLVLELIPGADDAALMAGMSKSTRQRILAAEARGTTVRVDDAGEHLDAFAGFMDATARRKGFNFGSDRGFALWWRRIVGTDRCRFLVAEHDGRLLGGLLAYRQGGHWATAFSADDATLRHDQPGTMHLLRWTAIQMARDDGAPTIDLGGVDVPGARRLPTPGEPQWGMYEHKIGFGARWVESAGAHEIVLRPGVYRTDVTLRDLRRRLRRLSVSR
jgi:lipid II:glycine glycyltransferase (peptidoglycan interpeptide bridge formation enzyme)